MKKYIKDYLLNCAPVNEKYKHVVQQYIDFIEQCESDRHDEGINEVHHIIPRSWNRAFVNDTNNQITLTVKQHILAHQILYNTYNKSMIIAFHNIVNTRSINDLFSEQWCIEAREKARIEYIRSKRRLIINLNTGVVYEGIKQTEKLFNSTGLGASIRFGTKFCNYWWDYYTPGIDCETLIAEKEATAQQRELIRRSRLKSYGPKLGNQNRPVVNLNTGERFESCQQASRALGMHKGAVASAIKNQNKTAGYWWEYESELIKYQSYQQRIDQYEQLAKQRNKQRIQNAQRDDALYKRPVRCIETGVVYDHAGDISLQLCGNRHRLPNILSSGRNYYKKMHWEFV